MDVWHLFTRYFVWHLSAALRAWWRIFANLLWFLYHFFSVPILFRTLFSPWRRLTEYYPAGFRPELAAETLLINLLMRLFGFSLRLVILVLAMTVLCLAFLAGVIGLGLWLLAPILFSIFFAIGFYLTFLA